MNPSLVLFTIMSKGYTRNPLHPPVGPLYSGRFKEYTRNPNLILFTQVQGVYQESQPGPFISGSRNIPGIPTWSSFLRFKEYTRNPNLILFTQVQGVYQESFPDPLFSGSRSIPGIPTWSSYLRVKEYTRNPFLILLS